MKEAHAAFPARIAPAAMKTSQEQALAEVTQMFLNFRGHHPPDQTDQWNNFDRSIARLVEEGWTRKDLYTLLHEIDTSPESMPEECSEAIGEYLSLLIGWCSISCLVPFPGEPSGVDELAAYVRGREWMK